MKKTNLALVVFTLMNFVVSMTACVFNGILDKVAVSLDISVANSGLLNTMYAYGAAFGVPITLILFRRIERTKMLKIMLSLTILMTIALAYAASFEQLLIIRLVMGIAANSYGVLATSAVISLSGKERQGRSMAIFIMGASLALVVGVPLTRALSSVFDWRSIFWILNAIMIISLVYFQFCLPTSKNEDTNLNIKNEIMYFKNGKISLIFTFTFLMFIGYTAIYNFVTPYMLMLFPGLDPIMSIVLVGLGIASFIGNYIGGQVSDRIGYSKSMLIGAVLQLICAVMIFLFQPFQWLSLLSVTFLILCAWFTGLQLNTGVIHETQNKSSFMISINSSAIQLGGAIGSSLASIVITNSGIQHIVFIALVTCLMIVIIQLFSIKKYSLVTGEVININENRKVY